jgi:hydroxyacylglutathione hydrolase
MLEIVQIPCLTDNYAYLVHDPESGDTACIDTPDAEVIAEALSVRGWTLSHILNTHWHPDHTGGNRTLKADTNATIYGPAAEGGRIPLCDVPLHDGDSVRIGRVPLTFWHCPGHTRGLGVYSNAGEAIAFVSDLVFAMGCGRVFEGTMAEMFASLQRLKTLPAQTRLYCAHEYSASNARFALSQFADDADIQAAADAIFAKRTRGLPTVPTTLADEMRTNPFLRAQTTEAFATLRHAKDSF